MMDDERRREIEQGLRNETGGLTFGLVVEEYAQGCEDYLSGKAPPRFTSASYDLGRNLGRRREAEAERKREVMGALAREQEAGHQRVRALLAESGRADVLADYDRQIAAIRNKPLPGQ